MSKTWPLLLLATDGIGIKRDQAKRKGKRSCVHWKHFDKLFHRKGTNHEKFLHLLLPWMYLKAYAVVVVTIFKVNCVNNMFSNVFIYIWGLLKLLVRKKHRLINSPGDS
jgi:hypothetical protein